MNRVINFSAGPSGIPLPVLEEARDEFLDYKGQGCSIIEMSHRGKTFEGVLNAAKDKVRELYGFGDEYDILFLQGGASLQFAQIPMNLSTGKVAQYIHTGNWTKKAIAEAKILGINYKVVASSEDTKFDRIPEIPELNEDADYTYICSNNTIYGSQYKEYPKSKAPLVVDSSSDLFTRKVDISNVGLFYGGIQKNGGPSGVTLVVIRKDMTARTNEKVPNILRYKTQVDANSMSNTPNTFGIYMLDLMLKWVINEGGLDEMDRRAAAKGNLLYNAIDEMSDFYKGHVQKDSRSLMNVVFNIADGSELEAKFVELATKEGMIGLKGHRVLGGIRASLYNAVTLKDVETLTGFMREFAKKNG
ncbi:MAG: 3-phosphoserine/phosphohydroxythreonine transaminase [Campylobacteraceae bacterium]|nr:3-phosphoserine/phosphohydroxythreonine transaminase [Campylobacteraceae bacterium]